MYAVSKVRFIGGVPNTKFVVSKKILHKRMKCSFFLFLRKKLLWAFLRIPLLKSFRPMFLITFPTVNGSGTIRLERNFRFLTTICTSYCVHFSRRPIKAPSFPLESIFFIHFILPCLYFRLFIF